MTDEEIPVEKCRYELVDYIVYSLSSMEEHQGLVTNWTAMLRALDNIDDQHSKNEERKIESVQQRVLLRFFICAAKLHARSSGSPCLTDGEIDPDLVAARVAQQQVLEGCSKKKQKNSSGDALTLSLLSALPDLISTFKVDTSVLQGLTSLPQFFGT